jgi:hypothetical protein
MPDQGQLGDFLGVLETLGGHAGNEKLAELLSWEEAANDAAEAGLIAKRRVVLGRGRGGLLSIAGKPSSNQDQAVATAPSPPPPQPQVALPLKPLVSFRPNPPASSQLH